MWSVSQIIGFICLKLHNCILLAFIDKIVVHHKEIEFGETVQKVAIYYKMIGYVELPSMSMEEKESYMRSFGRADRKLPKN